MDALTATGLEVSTSMELQNFILNGDSDTDGLNQIYGVTIAVGSNSPDGQEIGLLQQLCTDVRELLLNINSSFDPDQAQGVILDQRCAINNIKRQGGSYTIQPISITVNATVELQGLDANFNNPNGTGYTVQDNAGNIFILQNSITLTSGTSSLDFRAQLIGAVDVPINTIINPVTIIAGVTNINNPSEATTVGQNQETDPQFRVRRSRSPANNTTGFINGLFGKISNLPGVTEVFTWQNNGDTTDSTGTLGHTVWLIVAGGAVSDIANVLYNTINGAGMRGIQTFNIVQPSGQVVTMRWDNPIPENLYIKFSIQPTVSGATFNTTGIAVAMANNLEYGIAAFADTSGPTVAALNAINALGGQGVPVLVQVSTDNATWTDYVTPSDLQHQFSISSENIEITVI